MRRAAHEGCQPALIWSGAEALNEPDIGTVTGKSQLSNRSRLQIPESALCDVYELAAADGTHPHIEGAVPVGGERHELAVLGDRGVHFVAVEISYALDPGIGERITPEVIFSPEKPE